jgi:beta-lactamase class A
MSKPLRYTVTIALIIVSCGLTYVINEYIHHHIEKTTNNTLATIEENNSSQSSIYSLNTSGGFKFIKPIDATDLKHESPSLNGLKAKLNAYIERLKKAHKLINASVYVRYYGHGIQMSLNPQETYSPGSMLKVVNLLIYLKLSEKEPGLLDKKIVYQTPEYPIPVQTFNTSQIEAGKEYTIRDLLKYMIVYSDNRATCWLVANLDSKVYYKMMEDLKIPLPGNTNYVMTASQYSVLFKLLYSSTYLSHGNSEFALRLLNQSDFKNGLVRDLPGNVQVAHKFGEAGGKHQHQLHESGLIYMNYAPYLITIMTKGYAIDDLPPVISTISKMVYDDLSRIEE